MPQTEIQPRYPDAPRVILVGRGLNAGYVMGLVSDALKDAGAPPDEIDEWRIDAMSSTYEHLLEAAGQWVPVSRILER